MDFQVRKFINQVVKKFPELELKERISHISENLKIHLPKDYVEATTILINSLPEPNDPNLTDDDFGDFIYASYADFVAKNGCTKEYLDFSLNALKKITTRFSAEDAIRYFINSFPDKTLNVLEIWTKDSHYHVRRLTSEGTRPKLPWCQKVHITPRQTLPILNQLFCDKTRFVTRSVANHLNDVSKSDPKLVLTTLKNWKHSKKQNPKEMDYIINHSLRSLIKQGDRATLEFLGFSPTPEVKISNLIIHKKTVKIGSALEFELEIIADQNERLIVDYLIHFQNKHGQMKNKKVFKIKQISLKTNEKYSIYKKHPLREMTTRKLFPGKHKLEIQINGKNMGERDFELL